MSATMEAIFGVEVLISFNFPKFQTDLCNSKYTDT